MKTPFIILLFVVQLAQAQVKPQVAFTIKEKDLIPEGITYDPVGKHFYVGSIYKRKIVRIGGNGAVSDFTKPGQDDLLEVLGMAVDATQRRLWVCNNSPEHDTVNLISNVHVFDLKSGQLLKKYQLSGSKKHLFNDIYLTRSGDAYITDSDGGAVYVIRKGNDNIEEFIKPGTFMYPNGISATPDEKRIIVCARGLVAIDVESRKITDLRHPVYRLIGIDGFYRYKNSFVGIQNVFFPEAIHRFYLQADGNGTEKVELVAVNDPRFDAATTGVVVGDDFYFIANTQLYKLDGGQIKDPETLADILIMKVSLD
jgi:DNA-binding beta-propeller fold protein YncE